MQICLVAPGKLGMKPPEDGKALAWEIGKDVLL
jgi:hypothetical protein